MKESDVLYPLRQYLSQIRSTLALKISRVKGLMEEIGIGVTVTSLSFHYLESVHKDKEEKEDPLHGNKNTEIDVSSSSSSNNNNNMSSKSNKSNNSRSSSLKYCEKVNLNDYVKNEKTVQGNDNNNNNSNNNSSSNNDNHERPDGRKEGEENLFNLAFELHFALKLLHNSRKLSLLTGDNNLNDNDNDNNNNNNDNDNDNNTGNNTANTAKMAFSNSSESHPSNHIRIMIQNQYEKEKKIEKEEKEKKKKNIEEIHSKSVEDENDYFQICEKNTVISSHSAFGGNSVKSQQKIDDKEAELMEFSSLEKLYSSNRWGVCGFQPGNPLKDFQSNGLLALKSLTEFLLRYEHAACQLGEVFALHRSKFCTYAQVAVQLSKFAADSLRLTPTPYTPLSAPLQYLAKQPSWQLLSEQNCYQEIFNLAMLTFDEAWRASTEERGTSPHIGTYEQCLLYVRETLDVIISTVSSFNLSTSISNWFYLYLILILFSFIFCPFHSYLFRLSPPLSFLPFPSPSLLPFLSLLPALPFPSLRFLPSPFLLYSILLCLISIVLF